MKKTVKSTLPLGAAKSFWLMAVLTMGLAASVVSCKDDDDKNDGTSPTEAEAAGEQSSTFWNVVGQLVGADQICDDYRDKTFTPIIGTPKEGNETVREVLTNSEEAAARRFADLVTVGDGLPMTRLPRPTPGATPTWALSPITRRRTAPPWPPSM